MTQWVNYEAPNLGLLFYKRIYSENKHLASIQDGEMIFNVNKENSEFTHYYNDLYNMNLKSYSLLDIDTDKQEFTLYTTYPGLIAGVGYAHGSKSAGDAAIGFYFDHTTGLPTIPGSSVKGVLRSLFELDSDGKKEFTGDKSKAAIRFIIGEYEKQSKDLNLFAEFKESINTEQLERLKIEIFGNQDDEGKDVFYDAVIDIENTIVDKFLASDFITPHYPNLLKNPIPTQFLKVLPNVGFKFRFNLKDKGILNAIQKTTLFKQIILTTGLGAKTNVGYGQFNHNSSKEVLNDIQTQSVTYVREYSNSFPKEAIPLLKKHKEFAGEVVDQIGDYFGIKFLVGSTECKVYKKESKKLRLEIAMKVRVICSNDFTEKNHNLSVKNII